MEVEFFQSGKVKGSGRYTYEKDGAFQVDGSWEKSSLTFKAIFDKSGNIYTQTGKIAGNIFHGRYGVRKTNKNGEVMNWQARDMVLFCVSTLIRDLPYKTSSSVINSCFHCSY